MYEIKMKKKSKKTKMNTMPEGPEILDYYKFLLSELSNENLYELKFLSGKYTKKEPLNYDKLKQMLNKTPLKIIDLIVKGKTIFIILENGYSLVFTHGMTGWWSTEMEKHSRICLKIISKNECENSKVMYFVDPRNFGKIKININLEELNRDIDHLGPYILSNTITKDIFYSRINKKQNSKIGNILLDQKMISGIGNYLRCDILWYAKIDPECKIKNLSETQKNKLFNASVNICRYYAEMDYNLDFTPYNFNRDFFIYMQDTDIYGKKVIREKMGSRTIHYVKTNIN